MVGGRGVQNYWKPNRWGKGLINGGFEKEKKLRVPLANLSPRGVNILTRTHSIRQR